MRLYKRSDFIKLPAGTIYSRVDDNVHDLMHGLFCKTTDVEFKDDWVEQDLISEIGFPAHTTNGLDAVDYVQNLRDTFQDFRTDLGCGCRDGCYEDKDVFVVWDKTDITALINYLQEALKKQQP